MKEIYFILACDETPTACDSVWCVDGLYFPDFKSAKKAMQRAYAKLKKCYVEDYELVDCEEWKNQELGICQFSADSKVSLRLEVKKLTPAK